MAGVKGKSGGPRKNAGGPRKNSGGKRPGAGRPPKPKAPPADPVPQGDKDMLTLLQDVALGKTNAGPLQVRAAIAALPYTHARADDKGKKGAKKDRAGKASKGKFSSAPPPLRLVKK